MSLLKLLNESGAINKIIELFSGGSHLMTPEKFLDIVKEVNCLETIKCEIAKAS